MRARIALLAAAALAAGCSVKTEGAACSIPGTTDNCPAGQACGADRTCSRSAAACMASCLPFFCDEHHQQCTCPPNSDGIYRVDPNAPALDGGKTPTGVDTPAACRYRSLTAALEAASAHTNPKIMIMGGAATFSAAATGETFPLTVPAGATLTGAENPLDPAKHVISIDDSAATEGVHLQDGATLAGVTIQNDTATGIGVRVSCDTNAVKLDKVTVAAAGPGSQLATGIRIEDGCEVDLADVQVLGASGAGLHVERSAADKVVVATNVVLDQNGEGVRLVQGDLTLNVPTVKRSAAAGVNAYNETAGGTKLTISGGVLHHNGDTGVVLSGNTSVSMLRTDICQNGSVTVRSGRKVGGIYADGAPPSVFTFAGNHVFGNAGDQVMLAASGTTVTWRLDGTAACAPDTMNVFSQYGGDGGRGLVAATAKVSATFDFWQDGVKPASPSDYEVVGSGSIDAGGATNYCLTVPTLTCPAAQ